MSASEKYNIIQDDEKSQKNLHNAQLICATKPESSESNPLNMYLGSKSYNMYKITTSRHIPAKIQIHNIYSLYVQIEAGDRRKKMQTGTYSNSRGRFREMCDYNST